MAETQTQLVGSGVEALISKLRQQGIEQGNTQAQAILDDARAQAAMILQQAKQQAADIAAQAKQESDAVKSAGTEALELTFRDLVLKMRDRLTSQFRDEVQRLVGAQMNQQDFLQQLILEAVGRGRDQSGLNQAQQIEVLLPQNLVGVDELKKHPEQLKQGTISHFVVSLMGNILREGVTLQNSDQFHAGIRIYVKDNATVVDFTDQAITALLLEHLQPRFRALLEGRVG
jgi:V/A-type H+/Na+-transporting ATPase subunit E